VGEAIEMESRTGYMVPVIVAAFRGVAATSVGTSRRIPSAKRLFDMAMDMMWGGNQWEEFWNDCRAYLMILNRRSGSVTGIIYSWGCRATVTRFEKS